MPHCVKNGGRPSGEITWSGGFATPRISLFKRASQTSRSLAICRGDSGSSGARRGPRSFRKGGGGPCRRNLTFGHSNTDRRRHRHTNPTSARRTDIRVVGGREPRDHADPVAHGASPSNPSTTHSNPADLGVCRLPLVGNPGLYPIGPGQGGNHRGQPLQPRYWTTRPFLRNHRLAGGRPRADRSRSPV